jgi:hypothetical protein
LFGKVEEPHKNNKVVKLKLSEGECGKKNLSQIVLKNFVAFKNEKTYLFRTKSKVDGRTWPFKKNNDW